MFPAKTNPILCRKILTLQTILYHPVIMGVNAPKEHQRVIGKLMTALGQLFYNEKAIPFEPFSETMIDEGKTLPFATPLGTT